MELSFCDLRAKEVVNIPDGRNLGNIVDMVFDTCTGRVTGIVVPSERSFFNLFKNSRDIFIPYERICKIGKDIILVEINPAKLNARISEVGSKAKQTSKSNDTFATSTRNYYPIEEIESTSCNTNLTDTAMEKEYKDYYSSSTTQK